MPVQPLAANKWRKGEVCKADKAVEVARDTVVEAEMVEVARRVAAVEVVEAVIVTGRVQRSMGSRLKGQLFRDITHTIISVETPSHNLNQNHHAAIDLLLLLCSAAKADDG